MRRVIHTYLHPRKITLVATWKKAWRREVDSGRETRKDGNIVRSGKKNTLKLEIRKVVVRMNLRYIYIVELTGLND